jgi:hypothetical protein
MAVLKGLRSIRTLAGKVDRVAQPYRAYMQITCLEMEKARRDTERRSASRRIQEIDRRLAEIEAEQTTLLEGVRGRSRESSQPPADSPGTVGARRRRPFRVRY